MKILSPSEYKLQNPNAYLGDYLSYLENAQKEAEETLQNAKTLITDNSIIEEIKKQAEEIFQMAMLVEEYMGQIVLKSIDTLTLEELQTYFNFDEENRLAKEKKEQLESEKKSLKNRLAEIEKQIANNLYLNGRIGEFYEKDGVQIFFQENPKPYNFLEDLLASFSTIPSFEDVQEKLKEQLSQALQTECQIQNIELSSSDINELSTKIIELFRKCKNILNYSPNAKAELAQVILSDSGIKEILPEEFDENSSLYIIYDLMNLKKLSTAFYSNLPDALKEKLVRGRLQGETYNTLLKTYNAYQNGEELPSDDLSQEEKDEKKEIERKLEKIDYDLASLDTEKETQEEFLLNEEKMRSVLRERILETLQGKVSAKDIDSIIKKAENKTEKLKADLLEANRVLSSKTSDLAKAQTILLDQDYHYFFQSVERNNVRRIYKAFGVNVTEEIILPFLEEEKRRYEQIDIMINLQNKLSSIYSSIKEKKEKSNFITSKLAAYKESLRQLEEEYQSAIEEAFQKLKQKNLFYVNAPRISDESTVGNVIILPPEDYQPRPTDFNEVSGLKQHFWNMSTGIDENTKKRFLIMDQQFDNWEDYYQDLMQQQAHLIQKLFSFGKGPNGYFNFTSSEEEREKLKHIQTTIIEILSSIYDERKSFRQSLGDIPDALEPKKVAEIEHFLGKGANLSRENLVTYIDYTQSEIDDLRLLLANNRALCLKLGIELPEDLPIMDDTSVEDNNDLETKIQALDIEGVTNLEEAIAYRNLLLGLEEYTVPPAKVKQFYLEHKNH